MKARKIEYRGQEYPSQHEAARQLGVSVETVRQRHLKGQTSSKDFGAGGRPRKRD